MVSNVDYRVTYLCLRERSLFLKNVYLTAYVVHSKGQRFGNHYLVASLLIGLISAEFN